MAKRHERDDGYARIPYRRRIDPSPFWFAAGLLTIGLFVLLFVMVLKLL